MSKNYAKFLEAWAGRYGLTVAKVKVLQSLWTAYENACTKAHNGDRFFNTTDKDKASQEWTKIAEEGWGAMEAAAKQCGFLGIVDTGNWPSLKLPDNNTTDLPAPEDKE